MENRLNLPSFLFLRIFFKKNNKLSNIFIRKKIKKPLGYRLRRQNIYSQKQTKTVTEATENLFKTENRKTNVSLI